MATGNSDYNSDNSGKRGGNQFATDITDIKEKHEEKDDSSAAYFIMCNNGGGFCGLRNIKQSLLGLGLQ